MVGSLVFQVTIILNEQATGEHITYCAGAFPVDQHDGTNGDIFGGRLTGPPPSFTHQTKVFCMRKDLGWSFGNGGSAGGAPFPINIDPIPFLFKRICWDSDCFWVLICFEFLPIDVLPFGPVCGDCFEGVVVELVVEIYGYVFVIAAS